MTEEERNEKMKPKFDSGAHFFIFALLPTFLLLVLQLHQCRRAFNDRSLVAKWTRLLITNCCLPNAGKIQTR